MDTFEGGLETPRSLHKYSYSGADPIDNLDPSGHDFGDILSVFEILASFSGLSFSPTPIASGTGGPDVTKILNRTLDEVQGFYGGLSRNEKTKQSDTLRLSLTGTWGKAWDISEVRAINPDNNILYMGAGKSKNAYTCGLGKFAGTFAVEKQVFYAHAVNYALWGKMYRVVYDDLQKFGALTAASFSLAEAKAHVRAYKALPPNWDIRNENVSEALTMTEYGFTGKLPNKTEGLAATPTGEVTEDKFEWKWLPGHKP
jgi:hypothetical protein